MISLPTPISFLFKHREQVAISPFTPASTPSLTEFFSPPTINSWLPPLTIMAGLARIALSDAAPIFWIGRKVWPTPWLLSQLALTNPSIFIDPPDHATLLWAIDQCLRNGGSRIVIADGSRMNMTATRRLQLVGEAMHACCFLARPHSELSQLSAAARRWFVTPHLSDNDLPAWHMQLLRDRSSSLLSGMESPVWLIRTTRHAPQSQSHHVILNSTSCPFHLSAELVNRSAVPPLRARRYATA